MVLLVWCSMVLCKHLYGLRFCCVDYGFGSGLLEQVSKTISDSKQADQSTYMKVTRISDTCESDVKQAK